MTANRYQKNPIITIEQVRPSRSDFTVIGVFNCGVTKYKGQTILLLRVAENVKSIKNEVFVPLYSQQEGKIVVKAFDRANRSFNFSDPRFIVTPEQLYITSISHIRLARSFDGINFEIDETPFITSSSKVDEFGVEDPRVTKIGNTYYINYSCISSSGVSTCLARTKDFVNVEKLGIMFLPDNKDVAIFPKKIKGNYYILNRPVSAYFQKPEMWICKSKDLKAYYGYQLLLELRKSHFDSDRLGASCVPFLTKYGWIEIYHGATKDDKYCLGAILLDKNDPTKVLKRSVKPIMEPITVYEKNGFKNNIIFSCGCNVEGDIIHLYYGACDKSICYATLSIEEIIAELV